MFLITERMETQLQCFYENENTLFVDLRHKNDNIMIALLNLWT